MLKVLMVEDSKFFGKLTQKKIQSSLEFEVLWVETYAATKKLLENEDEKFFVALLDLILPDAPDGEIVDLVRAYNIPAIVFTGGISERLREQIWSKKIVDYVLKRDIEDINYIVSLIKRIKKNRLVNILVVDDSKTSRLVIKSFLRVHQYNVIEAIDGLDALGKIKKHNNIKMVITDYNMPQMDGFDLTTKIRLDYGKDEMSVIGISGRDDHVIAAQFLKNGANDFISKPFAAEEFYSRVSQNIEIIEHIERRKEAERQLLVAKQQAVSANQAKSLFLANMSHEIRTPMNGVLGLTHLALQTKLSAKQKDYLNKIQSSASSLLVIINDILDYSKIEAGKLKIEAVDFLIDDVLDKVANVLSIKAEAKGLEIIFETAADVPDIIVGDPLRLEQILINLVDNAIKFTEKGEILLSAEKLKETDEKKTGQMTLGFSVKDTGIGISRSGMDKLFAAFNQADDSITREYGGTGLGLTICKKLTAMMGGEISVVSQPGAGSTFSFNARFKRAPKSSVQTYKLPARLKNKRILVAAGNLTVAESVIDLLKSFSFRFEMVGSARSALKKLKKGAKQYDLTIIDLMLTDMSGVDLVQKIRQNKKTAKIPQVLMVTTGQGEKMIRHAKKEMVNEVLIKPITRTSLFDTLLEAFGQKKARKINPTKKKPEARELRFDGARVLLVEDNAINQQVAVEILEKAGFEVAIARNGKEALKALETVGAQPGFEAVLMDLQMPVMDGYTATRKIRSRETTQSPQSTASKNDPNAHIPRIPIIAMTAHAMATEREKCIAAGMDEHISKPFDPQLLLSTLARWIKPKINRKPAESNKSPSEKQPLLPSILPGFDIDRGLKQLGGNQEIYIRLLAQFYTMFGDAAHQMRNIIKKGDVTQAESLAHSIKGVAGNIAAMELYDLAGEFEIALQQSTEDNFADLLNRFEKALNIVRGSVNTLNIDLSDTAVAPKSPNKVNLDIVKPIIVDITKLLTASDLVEDELVERLKQAMYNSKCHPLMDQLSGHIADFEYDAALLDLNQMKSMLELA